MFVKTSLIDINIAIYIAHGGSRLKLTKRTKIDCSQSLLRKVNKNSITRIKFKNKNEDSIIKY